jgi:hypothetical protein
MRESYIPYSPGEDLQKEPDNVDFMGRPKVMRAGDSNQERHNDNLSIFTGWQYDDNGIATYYRNGVACNQPNNR